MPRTSAKIRNLNARVRGAKIPLDMGLAKRRRGRPSRVRPSEIRGRGDNYRWILNQVWNRLWPVLSKVQTEDEVIKSFEDGASPYEREFMPALASLVLKVLQSPKFPRKRGEAQTNFLADSLAGRGWITPRSSRDICERERAKEKRAHHIIRCEFYVECSCGYRGPARDNACPKCKAGIQFYPGQF